MVEPYTQASARPERSRGALARTHHIRPSTLVYPERPPQAAAEGLGTNGVVEGIWAVLDAVPDPEIPVVSVVDLGIVRDVSPERVLLTPTYTGCPATLVIETMVARRRAAETDSSQTSRKAVSPTWLEQDEAASRPPSAVHRAASVRSFP